MLIHIHPKELRRKSVVKAERNLEKARDSRKRRRTEFIPEIEGRKTFGRSDKRRPRRIFRRLRGELGHVGSLKQFGSFLLKGTIHRPMKAAA
jgi:hypothetical protein